MHVSACPSCTARIGYRSKFFTPGDRQYFQDLNVELRKKVSSTWELALTYLNVWYDIDIIQGKPGQPAVHADIVILEGLHNFTDRNSVRFELQHLSTKQDHGNWATAGWWAATLARLPAGLRGVAGFALHPKVAGDCVVTLRHGESLTKTLTIPAPR